jgi:hypothetical protein
MAFTPPVVERRDFDSSTAAAHKLPLIGLGWLKLTLTGLAIPRRR